MLLMRTRYLLGFVCAAAILVLVGIAIIFATQRFRANRVLVAHTSAVIGQLDRVESDLLNGIGAQRSYLLTGNRAYREIHRAGRSRIRRELAALSALVDDNPQKAARARDLGERIERRLDAAQNEIDVYESQGLAATQTYMRSNRGFEMSREIEQHAARMREVEQTLLRPRQEATERSAWLLWALGALGIPLGLVILIWIFMLQSREVRKDGRAEALAQTVSDDLGRSVQYLERASADLHELSRYAIELQSCRNISEALTETNLTFLTLLPECAGYVYLLRASQDYAEVQSGWGEHAVASHSQLTPQQCWALRRAQSHCVDDIGAGTVCAHLELPPPGTIATTACLPLIAQGTNLGLLYLSAKGRGPLPGLSLAITAAEQLSQALGNLRLQDSLRQQSIRDALTGLFNRRYLEESLPREIARCQRHGLPLAVMMLDLDQFKAFNNTHGHDGGDALLTAFGRVLQSKCRAEDIPCRYGGEEFALILPEAPPLIAQRRAEEIRFAIERMSVRHLEDEIGGVTVSIGLALFPQHGSDSGELLRLADATLYRAKQNGRNRVELYAGD